MQKTTGECAHNAGGLGTRARLGLSALIAGHVAAVFVGPWAFLPQRSILADTAYRPLQPYIQALGIDNGYRFFAPQPSESHLIRYEGVRPDGEPVSGYFPDRTTVWPRLRYHRRLMLAEWIFTVGAYTLGDDDTRARQREVVTSYATGYAKHLAKRTGAARLTLFLRTHALPSPMDVEAGMSLTDPRLYREERLVSYSVDAPEVAP